MSAARFRYELAELVDILAPIAHSILCLESPHSTLADVILYWAAICAQYRQLIDDRSFGLKSSVQQALISIINRQYREIINNGPHDAYFACLALDPCAYTLTIFIYLPTR